jgi:hypothetical protein
MIFGAILGLVLEGGLGFMALMVLFLYIYTLPKNMLIGVETS